MMRPSSASADICKVIPTMNIGYARVSTDDQNLRLQLETLKGANCRRVYQQKKSGARADRPELRRMIDNLPQGDVVVVARLDGLARSTRDLLELAEAIAAPGASLKSLGEPWADTTTPARKMVLTVFASIAEFERSLIRERTGAGRVAEQGAPRPSGAGERGRTDRRSNRTRVLARTPPSGVCSQ
jgi:DNA invertase Pin-like site-specific DNA recombinase